MLILMLPRSVVGGAGVSLLVEALRRFLKGHKGIARGGKNGRESMRHSRAGRRAAQAAEGCVCWEGPGQRGTGNTLAQRVLWWRNGGHATMQQCRCCEIGEGRETMQCTVRSGCSTAALVLGLRSMTGEAGRAWAMRACWTLAGVEVGSKMHARDRPLERLVLAVGCGWLCVGGGVQRRSDFTAQQILLVVVIASVP